MRWNPVLHWMAHVGAGSWAAFKRALTSLAHDDVDVAAAARTLRTRFSDLGFAEFFVDGTERWRSFAPLLAASPHQPGEAILTGARTENLVERLRDASDRFGCQTFEVVVDGFTSVKVHGTRLRETAALAKIAFEEDIGRRLARDLVPLDKIIQDARPRPTPRSWSVRSFDFERMQWVDAELPATVVERTSPYGERIYFVHPPEGEPFALPKREAIYAAAWVCADARERRGGGIPIIEYRPSQNELVTFATAPLPEPCARAACLAGGRASIVRDRFIVYERVPPVLASVILVSMNHLAPRFQFCRSSDRFKGRR